MTRKITTILLALALCLTLLPVGAGAATPAGTDLGAYLKGKNADSAAVIWDYGTLNEDKTVSITGYILNGGTYRLGDDVTIDKPLIIRGGTADNPVTLDLNGHVLKYNGTEKNSVIVVANDAYFVLQDTEPTKTHHFTEDTNGLYKLSEDTNSPISLTGGIITGGTGTNVGDDDYPQYFGGGVFVGSKATFEMTGGNIVGCTAGDKDGSQGGGVFVSAGQSDNKQGTNKILTTFTMIGGSIVGCTANQGGGVYERGHAVFTMGDTNSTNNARIASCTAENGGGVYVGGDNKFTMNGGTIESCTANGTGTGNGNGGGVNVGGSNTTSTMTGGTIKNCTATNIGGGVGLEQGNFTMEGGTIENCTANNGGGVGTNSSNSTFTMTNGTIKDCNANEKGKGVYIGTSGGTMDAQGGSVYGGVYISSDDRCNLMNTSLEGSTIFYSKDGKEAIVKDGSVGNIVGKRVKFMDGETLYAETVASNDGGKISEPVAPTKADNHFAGWYTAQTDGKKFEFTTAITADTTLYAGWHGLEKVDAKAATCNETGNKQYWKCTDTDCGRLFEDSEGKKETGGDAVTLPIDPTNHASTQLLLIPAKEADCKNGGNNDYYYCVSCDKYFKDAAGKTVTTFTQTAVDSNNHVNVSNAYSHDSSKHWKVCNDCTAKVDEAAHDFSSGNKCSVCGYVKQTSHRTYRTTTPSESAKTGDIGVAIYAVMALTSYTGTALVVRGRKRK